MKKIEAIIRREKLGLVRRALEGVGYPGLTITEVRGHGRQKGRTPGMSAEEYRGEFLPKLKLEIVAQDEDVPHLVQAIVARAHTGEIGDGKVFISEIQDVIRVRTGEEGESAL